MLAVGVGLAGAAPIYAAAPDLRAEAGLRIRYDDNVFQYSNRNLDRFSPSTLNKFATLESSDDVIVIPSIDVRATWKGRYATRAFAGVDLNQYTKNKDRSSPTYTLGVTQHLGRDTALTLRHRFVPTHLGWRLADPPNQTAAYANAELSSAEWRLAVDHDLNRILSTELYGAWEDRNYNAAFNERDITVKDVGLSGTVKLRRAIALRLGVARETGDAAGAGDAAVNSDTSYRQWSVRLRPTISPTRDWDLGLAYEYRRRDFTAALPADTNYFGREDTTHAVGVDSTVQLRKGVDLRADYDHIRRTSNKSGADLEFGNYTEQRITAGIDYRF
jgi:opacity protein-like surface antigen